MKLVVFLSSLGPGGTGKAACCWARGLKERGHDLTVLSLEEGPWRTYLEPQGIGIRLMESNPRLIADALREINPEVIHAHVPGHPHTGDVLGEALRLLPKKIPVLQTNIFGQLLNPKEDAWTDFRLFISWTSAVQAARRSFRRLDESFFRHASVSVYPVAPEAPPDDREVQAFRRQMKVQEGEVLFGRLSRPEPNKWTNLALDAFRRAARRNRNIKLLLREPPSQVARQLRAAPDADRFVILPATADADELRLTMAAFDAALHTSLIGESFGYGIAEPMNLGKPVIAHSVPWGDQAQIELVRHGECGFVASTPATMAEAIGRFANEAALRTRMGEAAQKHIRSLAEPDTTLQRVEDSLQAVLAGRENPYVAEDLRRATRAAEYLDEHQFGHSWLEQIALRPFYYRTRLHQLRQHFRSRKI